MEREYHKLTIKPINPDVNVIEDPVDDFHKLTSKTNTLTVSHREQPTQETINFTLANYIKLNWRGVWDSESSYKYNDAVSHLGSSYVALRSTTEEPSESAADWDLIAKKGDDGGGGTSTIDHIKVNGVEQPITNKTVDIPVPTQASDIGAEPANINIQSHISDNDIHHSSESLSNSFEPKNSNIQEHIADETIHHTIEALDLLYADIDHNHNLNDLAEKSYNSLTDKPSLNFEPANANIQTHISDATKHIDTTTNEFSGAIDETNDKFTIWDNSLLKWIRFSFTSMKTWLSSLYLKLDQTTPQTINGTVKVNGQVDATTTNVNQETIPSVNASQEAATLQDGSAFTGTDYVMATSNVAVKIVASAAHTMGDFAVRIKASATLTSSTNTITGYLYSDNSGVPSTLLATGQAIRHGSLTTSYQLLSLGTSYTMVAGTTYWFVLRYNSAPTGGNIILDSNVSTGLGATSTDNVNWTVTNVQLRYLVRGRTYRGMNSFSTNNYGVYGLSTNNIGVYGFSTNNYGVYGLSTNNYGVYGLSTNNIGVYGLSTNNYGVRGTSTNNIGVYGLSTNSHSGYFTRNTQTPTSAVSVLYAYQQHASNTNSVFDIRQNGTGEIIRGFSNTTQVFSVTNSGLGIFAKGVQIGDNTDVASVLNEFAIRGRKGVNGNIGYSVTEMCMPTDVNTWDWVEIVRNEWIIP